MQGENKLPSPDEAPPSRGVMAEKIFEIATGLLNEVEGVHVTVLKVEENK